MNQARGASDPLKNLCSEVSFMILACTFSKEVRLMTRRLFTSESVTEGHPDKIADQISDAVLDSILEKDPLARVACETLVTTGLVLVSGEITCNCYVDIPRVVRETVCEIGYTRAKYGFDGDTCAVLTAIDEQSSDIALGVDRSIEVRDLQSIEDELETTGAGDQGMMFGYASNETQELMPLPISLAHRLAKRLAVVRKNRVLPYLRPDGKTQVTVEYEQDRPVRVDTIIVSSQHHPKISLENISRDVINEVIRPVVPPELMDEATRIFVNPTGRFVIGGPQCVAAFLSHGRCHQASS
jgi:S-adenosylmethionine synthetase